ncbi:MAG: hypothetical protein ACRYE9_00135 [Janthinobacterium lividum]
MLPIIEKMTLSELCDFEIISEVKNRLFDYQKPERFNENDFQNPLENKIDHLQKEIVSLKQALSNIEHSITEKWTGESEEPIKESINEFFPDSEILSKEELHIRKQRIEASENLRKKNTRSSLMNKPVRQG